MASELAKKIWAKMNESERIGVKFGLFPYWITDEAPKEEQHQLTLDLMELAGAE